MEDATAPIRAIDIFDSHQCASLRALQHAAYQVEADLIAYPDLPPLKDSMNSLQSSGETFWGFYVARDLAGAISYKIVDATLDIHRMMVHPRYFRHGIASALLHFARERARAASVTRLIVSTGSANLPACTLYRRHGFHATYSEEIVPGLMITHFEVLL